MELSYEFYSKDGIFKYNCISLRSYLEISNKDIKKIYDILCRLDVFQKKAARYVISNCIYNDFVIIFDFRGHVKIENASNWLSIKEEIPIIKRKLNNYIQKYNIETVKDIIVKIKSLKKGK